MRILAVAFLALSAYAVPTLGCPECLTKSDIIQTATDQGFPTLVDLISKANLTATLKTEGPFTVFAPSEEAFRKLPLHMLSSLTSDPEALKFLLLAHVAKGKVLSKDLSNGMTVSTLLEGYNLTFAINKNGASVNMANIMATDVQATNGIIHVIDTVIIPQKEEDEGSLQDLKTSKKPSSKNIIQAITEKGLSSLMSLLLQAGLKSTLEGEGPFTIFAPADMAIMELPAETLQNLLLDMKLLKSVLLAHVVSGKVTSGELTNGMKTDTLTPGYTMTFTVKNYEPSVNGAKVIYADVEASNGIIHIIDKVLIPEHKGDYDMTEPEPEPEVEPEPKSKGYSEQNPKAEPEPYPEPMTEPKPEPETKLEKEPMAEPEPKPEKEPNAKPEPKPKEEPMSEPEPKP